MMRLLFLGGLAALAIAGTSAQAADIPMKARVMAPQWTGWNVGLSLGGRYADITGTSLSFGGGPVPFPDLATQGYNSLTYRIGGYVGYDWQFARNWVAGLEADFAWGDGKKHVDALQGIAKANTGNYSEARQTWDAGIRGRLGYLLDPTLLLYVTGGMQWQHFTATENCAINTCGPPPLLPPNGAPYLQTNSTTRAGWTVGGGIEKMLRDRWLIRAEYRYADYGTWTTSFGGTPVIIKAFDLATHTAFIGIAKKF